MIGDRMYTTLDPSTLTVFITGATSGFGQAAARRFAAAGGRVIATGRRRDRLEALQSELGAERCHIAELDVHDRQGIDAVIASLPAPFEAVNTVIANAGLALGVAPAAETDLGDWEEMVDTTIKGLIYTVRALLPRLAAQREGHVVTLGSVAGDFPYPGGNLYAASKAFVLQFALGLRADLQGKNVRVTNIEPGLTETEFSLVRFKGDAEAAAKPYANTERLTAEDVAEAIFWATTLPRHVNINRISMMPVSQSFGPLAIHRES
jgi:3-hydroxy acid dehydrogenase/malonic semialdehyde reductase